MSEGLPIGDLYVNQTTKNFYQEFIFACPGAPYFFIVAFEWSKESSFYHNAGKTIKLMAIVLAPLASAAAFSGVEYDQYGNHLGVRTVDGHFIKRLEPKDFVVQGSATLGHIEFQKSDKNGKMTPLYTVRLSEMADEEIESNNLRCTALRQAQIYMINCTSTDHFFEIDVTGYHKFIHKCKRGIFQPSLLLKGHFLVSYMKHHKILDELMSTDLR